MLTESQYHDYRARYDAYESWRNGKTRVNPGEVPENARISNEERSAIEIYEFHQDKPDSYFAYVQRSTDPLSLSCKITTWMGDLLGTGSLGNAYRSNFGDQRRSIRIKGVNGVIYYGTFYESSGDYCHLRATKPE